MSEEALDDFENIMTSLTQAHSSILINDLNYQRKSNVVSLTTIGNQLKENTLLLNRFPPYVRDLLLPQLSGDSSISVQFLTLASKSPAPG